MSGDFVRLFAAMPQEVVAGLASRMAASLRERGVTVNGCDGLKDVPFSLTPEIVTKAVAARREHDAQKVLSSVIKAAQFVLATHPTSPAGAQLLSALGPLERRAIAAGTRLDDVTIARVDWFVDHGGDHHALEVNSNIPALEVWSDRVAGTWLEVVGSFAGLTLEHIAGLRVANGSNAEDLRRSLVAHSQFEPSTTPSILIIHRDHDTELMELEALRDHFEAMGHPARRATPDQIVVAPDRTVVVEGRSWELLYRHIHAKRVPAGSGLEAIALGKSRPHLQNATDGRLGLKSMLGELKRLEAEDPGAIQLDQDEREVVARTIPWTRVLTDGPAIGPDGQRIENLAALAQAVPERLVLKKSQGHGGTDVVIGTEVPASRWRADIQHALSDTPGTWILQELVSSPRHRHLVVAGSAPTWSDVFVDAATFTASGTQDVPTGGLARFASGGIVNVGGGGGLAPLILESVAEPVWAALDKTHGRHSPPLG